MKQNRLLALAVAAIFGALNLAVLYWPEAFLWSLGANILTLAIFWQREQLFKRAWLNALSFIHAEFFILSFQVYLAFSASRYLALSWLIAMSLLYYRLIADSSRWLSRPLSLPKVNWQAYSGFFTVFFSVASIYGLETYLNLPLGLLVLIALFGFATAFSLALWASGGYSVRGAIATLVAVLLIAELAWALSFLPLRYQVTGFIVAVNYYLLLGLTGKQVFDKLDKRDIRLFITLALAFLLLVLATARWY